VSATEERAFLRSLGDCVRLLRLDGGLSQEQLAAVTGLSLPFVGQVERGTHAPNVLDLRRIADALRVPLAVLVDEAADPSPVVGLRPESLRAGRSRVSPAEHRALLAARAAVRVVRSARPQDWPRPATIRNGEAG